MSADHSHIRVESLFSEHQIKETHSLGGKIGAGGFSVPGRRFQKGITIGPQVSEAACEANQVDMLYVDIFLMVQTTTQLLT